LKAMIAVPCPPLEVLSDQEAWKLPVEEVMTYAARPCTPEPELKSRRAVNDADVSVETAPLGKFVAAMTRSWAFVVVSDGVVIVVDEEPLPLEDRSNPVTPDHSEMFTATALALESVTVTELTAGALSRYQISTRLLIPVRKPTGPFVHAPPESETEFTEAELPAAKTMMATSVFPDVDAGDKDVARLDALDEEFLIWPTKLAPPPDVIVMVCVCGDSALPTLSTAKNCTVVVDETRNEPP